MLPPPRPAADQSVEEWMRRQERAQRRSRLVSQYAGAFVAVLVLIVAVVVLVRSGDEPWADSWDPRVTEIVAFVEQERGLEFQHAVYVDFLSEAEYRARAGGFADPDQATIAYYEDEAAILNAQGLVSEGYDALESLTTWQGDLTLGYYSPDTRRMVILGTELTPATRVVLAHELTHALQDQHFSLAIGGNDLPLRAIIEADAFRVEAAYTATLSSADQAAADAGLNGDAETAAAASEVPWPVLDQLYAPYALGPTLVEQAFTDGGNAAVDSLIRNPPTEEVLANPWLPTTEPQAGSEFAAPGTEIRPISPLSYLNVLIMLDAWLPWQDARTALVGWNGGGSRAVVELGSVCFEMFAEMAEPQPLADALTQWVEASGATGTPTVSGNRVDLSTCERSGGRAPQEATITTVGALMVEQLVVREESRSTAPGDLPALYCYVGALVDGPAADVMLMVEPTAADQARLDDARAAADAACLTP